MGSINDTWKTAFEKAIAKTPKDGWLVEIRLLPNLCFEAVWMENTSISEQGLCNAKIGIVYKKEL